MFRNTLVLSIVIFSMVFFPTEQLYSQKIDEYTKTIDRPEKSVNNTIVSKYAANFLPTNLYLRPDGTMQVSPFIEEYDQDIYVNGYFVEWKYPIPGDISSNSFGLDLVGGSQGINGTQFKAELLLKTNSGETLIATKEFFGACFYTLPFYDIYPKNMRVTLNGTISSAVIGDTLCVRLSVVSGAAGRIMYGTNYGVNSLVTELPAKPTLANPTNNAQNQPVTLNLSWNSAIGATGYHLQVSTTSNFTNLAINDSTISALTKQLSGLSGSTNYYWRVRARNAAGSSTWSEVWNFTTSAPPAVPALVSPSNNAQGQPTTLNLSWNSAMGATGYQLQVSTSSNFTTLIFTDSTITTTTKQVSGLNASTKYYWRVRARNAGGSSTWSEVWNFTTLTMAAVPTLSNPTNGAQNQPVILDFIWNSATGTTGYQLQVSISSNFTTLIFNDSTITATTKQVSGLNTSTEYYWRVRAKNAAGSSAWSEVWSFNTSGLPAAPTLSGPINNSQNQQTTLNLFWNNVEGALSYKLQVSANNDYFIYFKVDSSNIISTSIQLNGLNEATKYYWRVCAINNAGLSEWSEVWNFATLCGWVTQLTEEINYTGYNGVSFTNAQTGIVVGEHLLTGDIFGTEAIIMHTTNGGITWDTIWTGRSSESGGKLLGVSFADANNGTAVGYWGGNILRTTDGGTTWIEQTSEYSGLLIGVSFSDVNTGTVVGNDHAILHTTNGGSTWITQSSGQATGYFNSVWMTDANTGTVVGQGGIILRTTNGGNTWTPQTSGTSKTLNKVFFVNANIGTVVGDNGIILHTTDGGINWVSQSTETSEYLTGVFFTDANNGTVVGSGRTILHTTDGGITWINQTSTIREWTTLLDVTFVNANVGIITGESGTILRTISGGVISSVNKEDKTNNNLVNNCLLKQNYPNPFNPSTSISFSLPKRSFVSLKVFDLLGKEVVTIVSEELTAGNYSRQWNAVNMSSGIYFYRLQAGSFTQTKKLLLLK